MQANMETDTVHDFESLEFAINARHLRVSQVWGAPKVPVSTASQRLESLSLLTETSSRNFATPIDARCRKVCEQFMAPLQSVSNAQIFLIWCQSFSWNFTNFMWKSFFSKN